MKVKYNRLILKGFAKEAGARAESSRAPLKGEIAS